MTSSPVLASMHAMIMRASGWVTVSERRSMTFAGAELRRAIASAPAPGKHPSRVRAARTASMVGSFLRVSAGVGPDRTRGVAVVRVELLCQTGRSLP